MPEIVRADERPDHVAASLFYMVHAVALVVILVEGFSWSGVLWASGMYYLRMFGVTAGYHRYFSHRAFKTSRPFQLLLAILGTLAVQKGVLWWAAHHRDHHRYSDQPEDIHSPAKGFWWSHAGWILCRRYNATKHASISDFAKFPELAFLDRYHLVPVVLLAVLLFVGFGQTALLWGFFVSTAFLWHGTFSINSLAHRFGRQRYGTSDTSRNSMLLALLTLGEGWHNNHHHYQLSARQGFFWWELDPSFYVLRLLERLGIVWDVKVVPARIRDAVLSSPAPAAA